MTTADTAPEKREGANTPLKIGLIDAGFMGREILATIESSILPGMEVSAVYNRKLPEAGAAFDEAGIRNYLAVKHLADADLAILQGYRVISSKPKIICRLKALDVIIELTDEVEFGAKVTLDAIRHKKHIVLLNTGLYATIGPLLKIHAEQHGVILCSADEDQAALMTDLYRIAKTTGHPAVLAENIKTMLDHQLTHRNQQASAGREPLCRGPAASFAESTSHAMEMAVAANARAARFNDAAMTRLRNPFCEVITVAKKRLEKGTRLDGIGGRTCYGILENADAALHRNLLPIGLSAGSTLIRHVIKNQPISFEHVKMPEKSLSRQLWREQTNYFNLEKMAG